MAEAFDGGKRFIYVGLGVIRRNPETDLLIAAGNDRMVQAGGKNTFFSEVPDHFLRAPRIARH